MSVTVRIDPRTAMERLGRAFLRRRAERIADLAKVYAAPHGSIAEGIMVVPEGAKSYKVISTNPNTVFVHNGTRPHVILPRRGKYLVFEVGGRTVYARRVNHPGNKADPFLTRALRDAG